MAIENFQPDLNNVNLNIIEIHFKNSRKSTVWMIQMY